MRVNVWIPDELAATVRRALPDLNLSATIQDALRERLVCQHERAVCGSCSAPIDPWSLADTRLDRFYLDAMDALEDLMRSGGTVEGSARVLKEIAGRHHVPIAATRPLPRLTRAARTAQRVRDLEPRPRPGRRPATDRHPAAHTITEAS
jgi:hypothetical protein